MTATKRLCVDCGADVPKEKFDEQCDECEEARRIVDELSSGDLFEHTPTLGKPLILCVTSTSGPLIRTVGTEPDSTYHGFFQPKKLVVAFREGRCRLVESDA